MQPDFRFRSGKYATRTYEWVLDNDPSYIEWIKENRPEMLRVKKKEEPKKVEVKQIVESDGNIPFNDDFLNQPPEAISIPYMIKDKDKYKDKLEAFKKVNKTEYRLILKEYEE